MGEINVFIYFFLPLLINRSENDRLFHLCIQKKLKQFTFEHIDEPVHCIYLFLCSQFSKSKSESLENIALALFHDPFHNQLEFFSFFKFMLQLVSEIFFT